MTLSDGTPDVNGLFTMESLKSERNRFCLQNLTRDRPTLGHPGEVRGAGLGSSEPSSGKLLTRPISMWSSSRFLGTASDSEVGLPRRFGMVAVLENNRNAIAELCTRYGVVREADIAT